MSTSLLAFLTLLEKRVLPLLPAGKTWRFQRIVDFRAGQAVLQVWEESESVLAGQVELREARHEDGAPSYHGMVQSVVEGVNAKGFSFHPNNEADVERQAELVADMWRRTIGAEG